MSISWPHQLRGLQLPYSNLVQAPGESRVFRGGVASDQKRDNLFWEADPMDSLNARTEPDEQIPEWWNVYEGLSDEEIDRLDQAIRERADLTRPVS
jgi:hypothetical protein